MFTLREQKDVPVWEQCHKNLTVFFRYCCRGDNYLKQECVWLLIQILDTIAEIQERHDAVRDIEKKLLALHQVFFLSTFLSSLFYLKPCFSLTKAENMVYPNIRQMIHE